MSNIPPESLEEVFVTDGFPTHTYVDADEGRAERELRDGLAIERKILSIVGPSKCGKTTLCDHVFGTTRGASKILISGDSFDDDNQFWRLVFAQTPAAGEYDNPPARDAIIDLVAGAEMPLLIDDFHYVSHALQTRLCQQMKGAAARGIRFVVLTANHRGDDPVRSNPDLAGRFFKVDMNFWDAGNLEEIAIKGFSALNVEVSRDVTARLARESLGSPQLMQTLCLETGRLFLDADMPFAEKLISDDVFRWSDVRTKALRSYDNSALYNKLQSGPPRRGQARNQYELINRASGDVYDVIAYALGTDPVFSELQIEELRTRASKLLKDPHQQPNFDAALQQLNDLFDNSARPLEFDDEHPKRLSMIDPHFYFYVRAKTAENFLGLD